MPRRLAAYNVGKCPGGFIADRNRMHTKLTAPAVPDLLPRSSIVASPIASIQTWCCCESRYFATEVFEIPRRIHGKKYKRLP
jgi:hypothetical protein